MGIREYNFVINALKRARTIDDLGRAITRMGFDLGEPDEASRQVEQFRRHCLKAIEEEGKTEEEAVKWAAEYLLNRVFSVRVLDGEHKGIR